MDRADIEKSVIEIVASQAGREPDDIDLDHRLVEDLGYDSLDVVEVQIEVEDEFELMVPIDRWEKVCDIIDCVEERTNG